MFFWNKKTTNNGQANTEKEELGYGNWLFRTKGTAAEPWPTAEDLWNDPDVQKAIQSHNQSVRAKKQIINGDSKTD